MSSKADKGPPAKSPGSAPGRNPPHGGSSRAEVDSKCHRPGVQATKRPSDRVLETGKSVTYNEVFALINTYDRRPGAHRP
jgi:hypothetical protein